MFSLSLSLSLSLSHHLQHRYFSPPPHFFHSPLPFNRNKEDMVGLSYWKMWKGLLHLNLHEPQSYCCNKNGVVLLEASTLTLLR